jgi:hypothetical protein
MVRVVGEQIYDTELFRALYRDSEIIKWKVHYLGAKRNERKLRSAYGRGKI